MPRRPQLKPPALSPLNLPELEEGDPASLEGEGRCERARFTDVDVSGRDLSGIEFSECELLRPIAHETRLRGARFVETRIERMLAPALDAPGCTLRDVELTGSRLGAVELHDAEVRQLVVEDSRIDWLNLRGGRMHDVVFRRCRFGELDLVGLAAERVAFEECGADSVRFRDAVLRHADLRGLEMGSVSGLEGMKGTVITPEQSMRLTPAFAEHFGLMVAE